MKDFRLSINNLGYFVQEITKLLQTKKEYRVSIKEWRDIRTLSQNSMYWFWLYEISQQYPLECDTEHNSSDLWHEVFKNYYCPVKQITNNNANLNVKSTKLLDIGEMTHYLNKIETFCIDRNIKLTIPDDSQYHKLMESQEQ